MDILKEYLSGFGKTGHKYLQRFGSPGHFKYVYLPAKLINMSSKAQFYWSKLLGNSKKFIKKLAISYDAKSVNIMPKSLSSAVINIKKSDDSILNLHVNLKSHGIYSYRSSRGKSGGASTSLAKSKKSGILRFR